MIGIRFKYSDCALRLLNLCIPKKLRKWDAKAQLWVMEREAYDVGVEKSYELEVRDALRSEGYKMIDIGRAFEALREAAILNEATLPQYVHLGHGQFQQTVRN